MMARAGQVPEVAQVFSLFETSTPQLYLDIDRTKAQMLGVSAPDVFAALQIYIGSSYVNDFNLFGRTFRVTAQADSPYRLDPKDVAQHPGAQFERRHRAARLVHHRARHRRALPGAALQPLPGGRARRRGGARLLAGPGDRRHGAAREPSPARRLQLRVDHARLPAAARRQHGHLRVRAGGGLRLPGAGGAVREPHAAPCRDPDRADVSRRLDRRRGAARPGQQYPHPGRLRGADRPCGQERHSDHRVRQAARGPRPRPLGSRGRGGAAAAAADPDDLVRLHLRRDAAGVGGGGGRRAAADARHRGVLRDDRGDRLRADLHAGLLRGLSLDRREKRAGMRRRRNRPRRRNRRGEGRAHANDQIR